MRMSTRSVRAACRPVRQAADRSLRAWWLRAPAYDEQRENRRNSRGGPGRERIRRKPDLNEMLERAVWLERMRRCDKQPADDGEVGLPGADRVVARRTLHVPEVDQQYRGRDGESGQAQGGP